MKILLANPATRITIDEEYERFFVKAGSRWPWSTVKRKDRKNTNIFFPFYIAYSASVLMKDGHDVFVIDGVAMDMPESEFLERVSRICPDMIALESTTHSINSDIALARKIKSSHPRVKIVFAGPHATVFAGDILMENEVVDFITLGEYEYTLLELADRINKGASDFRVTGIAFKDGSDVWISEKRGFIDDINKLPLPAFELFPCNDSPDLSIYTDGICTYHPAVTLHSSRGCPFQCDFCLWNQVMYGNGKYRTFKPERVVDEMEHVIKHYGAREIYFDDDDFCVSKKHVLAICDEIRKRGLKIKWSCMGDAMCADEEMIRNMSEAGCIFMKFGVESGNTKILKNIGKPLIPEKAIEVSRLCRKNKIRTHATFSFGLDGETMESMEDTLRLANRIKFDYAQVSITTPFPGTRYFEKLKKRGELKEPDWDKFDGTNSCVFSTSSLGGDEIERFRKRAIRSMIVHKIIDPVWLLRYLQRSFIVLKHQGPKQVLVPFSAIYYTFFKGILKKS